MSVSFMWEVVKPDRATSFARGTSRDHKALDEVFPEGKVTTRDIPTLRAMHLATLSNESLWSEIADTLERLAGGDYSVIITLKIWTQY